MIEEPSDYLGRWFARYDDDGNEVFSARLLHNSPELEIAWTDQILWLPFRVRSVEALSGVKIDVVTGGASHVLETQIRTGTFDADAMAHRFGRVLGGQWEVFVTPRPKAINAWDMIIRRKHN